MPQVTFLNSDFVPLHNHSEYSNFDGLSKLDDMVMKARQMRFPAIALTDHGNVAGWIKFLQAAKKDKDKNDNSINHPHIKAILGMETYLARNHLAKSKEEQPDGRKGNRHLNLFAMNWIGYQNLCSLSHEAFVNGSYYKDPRIDIELLVKHRDGLVCSSACLSSVINANLLNNRYDSAKKTCALFKDIFKDNFFLEIMYHGLLSQKAIIPDIIKLSKEMNIPICATQDAHYIEKRQAKSQEILMAMSTSRCLKDPSHIKFPYDEFYLKSAEEMGKIFGDAPEFIWNTVAIADRIDTEDIEKNIFGGMRLPKFDIPTEFKDSIDYVKHLALQGMKKLGWDKSEVHMKQLELEVSDLRVAKENNNYDFATYFLIIWDIIKYAKENNIVVGPGRGSGFSSVLLRALEVCYGPDPIKSGLLWTRFLGFDDSKIIKSDDFGVFK